MIRPKNETKDLWLSIKEICETLIHQVHTDPEETVELKLIKPKEIFYFNPPILVEGSWLIRLTRLEVYNRIFNITEENNFLNIEANKELMIEKSQTDGYYLLLLGYTQSPFRVFERTSTDLDEEDIQLIIKQNNLKFITYKLNPGTYTFKDLFEHLSRGFQREFGIGRQIQPNIENDEPNSIIIECDSNTLRTKLVVRHEINALRFDEKSFFSIILGLSP